MVIDFIVTCVVAMDEMLEFMDHCASVHNVPSPYIRLPALPHELPEVTY